MSRFKLDRSGKTDAFFFLKDEALSNNDINFLKKKSDKKQKNIRICFHKNKKCILQIMVNLLFKKNAAIIHKHIKKDEFYHLIEGRLKINIFSNNKSLKKVIILDKKKKFYYLNKKTIHQTIPLTNRSIFLECRIGPFEKNDTIIYPTK